MKFNDRMNKMSLSQLKSLKTEQEVAIRQCRNTLLTLPSGNSPGLISGNIALEKLKNRLYEIDIVIGRKTLATAP